MKFKRLRLRGAAGLRPYGDEINIDFGNFDSGVIALVGENGAGKTTILESMQPWPNLISRSGSLIHHFHLQDSARELEFEYGGHDYLCKILIDGQRNKLEAYLYRDGKPVNDGNVPSYKKCVNRIFGSPDVFFKSIFLSQNGERISELTAGPSKDFFCGLLGFDRYESLAKAAKSEIGELEKNIGKIIGQIEKLEEIIASKDEKLGHRSDIESGIAEGESEIARIESDLAKQRSELEKLEKKAADRNQMRISIDRLLGEIDDLEKQLLDVNLKRDMELQDIDKSCDKLQSDIQNLQQDLQRADDIRQNAQRLEELKAKKSQLDDQKANISDLSSQASALCSKIETEANRITGRIESLRKQLADAENRSSQLEEVPCKDTPDFVATCSLIDSARKAKAEIEPIKKAIADAEKELAAESADDKEYRRMQEQITSLGDFDESGYNEIKRKIKMLEQTDWRKLISDLDRAEVTIAEKQNQIQSLKKQKAKSGSDFAARISSLESKVEAKKSEKKQLESEIGPDPSTEISILKTGIQNMQSDLSGAQTALGELRGQLKGLDELQNEIENDRRQADELSSRKDALARDIADYRLLEEAFGKNGIPAFKLEAAGPAISSIATEILQEFGREWSISIRTLRASADKKKDIETFEIIVSSPAGVKNFDDLSGGEKIWIEESLRKAVMIYLIKHSGRDFRTIMQDEADGALDPERAKAFLETTLKAHELTGVHHTIIISQRPDIWQLIPQRIHLHPEEGRIETVVN